MDVASFIRILTFLMSLLSCVTLFAASPAITKQMVEQDVQTIDQKKPEPNILEQIKILRTKGDYTAAKSLALKHLKAYPKDVDVMLLLGLLYYQEKDYTKAENYLNHVLQKVPTYLDAKIGLIRIKLAQQKYQEAHTLIKEAVKQSPHDAAVKEVQLAYQKAMRAKEKSKVKKIKNKEAEKKSSRPVKYDFVLKDIEQGNIRRAESFINRRLPCDPCDLTLLAGKAKVFFVKHQYERAAYVSREILKHDEKNGNAKELLSTIQEIDPHRLVGLNEVGISTFNQYVPDLKATWDASSLYYSRATPIGSVIARFNWARRLGEKAPQVEGEFLPIITKDIYLDLDATAANQPALFPKYAYLVEPYFTIPKFVTFSLGWNYNYIIGATYYRKITGSFSTTINNFWLSLRGNRYVPSADHHSNLMIATIRRYFSTSDSYVNLTIGTGTSPDLADLQTLNFLIIKNRFADAGIRFPILNHRLLVDVALDYQHWEYPSGLVRRLYGLNLGLNYKF